MRWGVYKLLSRAKHFKDSFSGEYFIVCLFIQFFALFPMVAGSLLGEEVRLIVYCKRCGLGCICSLHSYFSGLVWRSAMKTKDNSPQKLLSMVYTSAHGFSDPGCLLIALRV